MSKNRNFFRTFAAALGLLALPATATVAPEAPTPTEARQEAPSPVAKTDARHTRYYTPKGTRKRERSRTTNLMAVWGEPAGCNRNRFARRAVIKAAMRKQGRVAPDFTPAHDVYRVNGRPTTARTLEKMLRVRSAVKRMQERQRSARIVAAAEIES